MKTYILLGYIILITGCKDIGDSNKEIIAKNRITIESIADHFFSQDTLSLKGTENLFNLFSFKKSIEYGDENEQLSWSSIDAYNKRGKLAFKVEANWQNKQKPDRLTIYSNDIETKGTIRVGDPFLKIKKKINSNKLNQGPDGELSFSDKRNEKLIYYFDVTNNKKLYNGISSIDEMPDTLKIDMILMFRSVN